MPIVSSDEWGASPPTQHAVLQHWNAAPLIIIHSRGLRAEIRLRPSRSDAVLGEDVSLALSLCVDNFYISGNVNELLKSRVVNGGHS